MITDTCVIFGEAVKALDDKGKVGGYLVRFSTMNDPDISDMKDFFTPNTDFDMPNGVKNSTVYYQHGLDSTLGTRKIGTAEMKTDDVGVWVEAQLNMADEYEQKIFELAKDGKLGWSSGTASHLIEREAKANGSHEVLSWPLGLDASLTPNPAEPRNKVITSLKSWALENDLIQEDGTHTRQKLEDQTKAVIESITHFKERIDSLKKLRESQGRNLSDAANTYLENTATEVKNLLGELEALRTVPNPEVVAGELNTDAIKKAQSVLLNSY